MKRLAFVLVLALFAGVPHLTASGPLGIYGIVEKVVFEPNEANAGRIQVWGAFAYFDADAYPSVAVSSVARGCLYFRLPVGSERRFGKEPSLGFTDCLLLEVSRKAGYVPLGTSDRNLGKLDGAERLSGMLMTTGRRSPRLARTLGATFSTFGPRSNPTKSH